MDKNITTDAHALGYKLCGGGGEGDTKQEREREHVSCNYATRRYFSNVLH